jgi:hypothetical protein
MKNVWSNEIDFGLLDERYLLYVDCFRAKSSMKMSPIKQFDGVWNVADSCSPLTISKRSISGVLFPVTALIVASASLLNMFDSPTNEIPAE